MEQVKKQMAIAITAVIVCCGFPQQTINEQTINGDEFYVINLEQCLKSERTLLASELFDTVEYVILNTPRKTIISGIRHVVPFKDHLFIVAQRHVYQFTLDGQYVRQIGSRGQGPGEYTSVWSVFIDEHKKEIVIGSAVHLLFYSMEGVFLRSLRLSSAGYFTVSDSLIWIAKYPNFQQKFQAISFTTSGDTVSCIFNSSFGKFSTNGYFMSGSELLTPFYYHNENVFYKGYEDNDTIRKLSGSVAKPHAYIDMGRYKLPPEHAPGTQGYEWYAKESLGIPLIFEDNNYFFFRTQGRYSEAHPTYHYSCLAFDKKRRSGFLIKNEKEAGITDDILGGINIKPLWCTDEYFISTIEGFELLEGIESGKYSPVPTFQKQLSTITEDTNQLIILCKKKK